MNNLKMVFKMYGEIARLDKRKPYSKAYGRVV